MRVSLIAAIAVTAVLALPGVAPAQAPIVNDSGCVPNPLLHVHTPNPLPPGHAHPPVILVHGTPPTTSTEPQAPWSLVTLAAKLRASGYCPWWTSYPASMSSDSAAPRALASFANNVLANTGNGYGSGRVSMIGHSQGGMQIRHMLMHHAVPVDDAVSLAGTQKGSAHPLGVMCTTTHNCPPGFEQQLATDPFYDHLNGTSCSRGGALEDFDCYAPRYGSADYTNIATMTDELVFPYWRALMMPAIPPAPPVGGVADVALQVWCPAAHADHLSIVTEPHVFRLILDALQRPGPADATGACVSDPT